MSLFKVRQWWSNARSHSVETNDNIQNIACMKIDKFNSHNDSDCILLSEGNHLKLYKPCLGQDSSLLETELDDIVLQIETGKFIGTSGDREIIILHPQCYIIYELHRKGGLTDAGDQNHIEPLIKHYFKRRAYNLTCGPFGSSKSRDLICVQSLDSTLSFFDQDTFLFMCMFNDILIPGPVSYVASSDLFIICKSTWALEIYSYQQLRELSELSLRQNKNNIPQWTYNAGEEISSVQVIRTSNNFSSIIALGERHLYAFQDNGLMKDIIRLDYTPICFHCYLIGWYYEPGARLLVMVVSDDSRLFVYEGTTLLWACDLMTKTLSISRCFLNSLPGGIVSLGPNGVLTVNYLGTEPDLNPNVNLTNEPVDPEQIHVELESIEESLKQITADDKGVTVDITNVERTIVIKANVGKPVQNTFEQINQNSDSVLQFLQCPLIVMITCEEPKLIQSIQITYICSPPFEFTESTKCIDDVNGTEIIETRVFLLNENDLSDTQIKILFTIVDQTGKVVTLYKSVLLPLSLYCTINDTVLDNQLKLNINVNDTCLDFGQIFTDFMPDQLIKLENTPNTITFKYRTTGNTITLKGKDQEYSIESNDFPEIASILVYFLHKLNEHYMRSNIGIRLTLKPSMDFILQMIHRFLKSIETHSKERIKLKKLEDDLDTLQRQFTVIQKRLLVQYGSLPPGDCDPLEFLMRDTHDRLTRIVQEIIQSKDIVCRAGSTLASIGHLIVCILRNISTDTLKVSLIEEMLSLDSLHTYCQEWEEVVTQSSAYVSNKFLNKSDKDKEKLAPVMEQGILSHINMKRFLKQLRIILERVFEEEYDENIKDSEDKGNKIIRTEELVEII
ncbi:unnamed protein product [Parnassius mnemosyne]|uniref:Protein PTHB1 n=1 Tax=Parnassius mnemosyne TaxID=213953 RepID=A0AAV1KI58_9NEOP